MWSESELTEQLLGLGVEPGGVMLAHIRTEAIGPIDGGPEALIRALRCALGPKGTLLLPAPPSPAMAELASRLCAQGVTVLPGPEAGELAAILRTEPDSACSGHPLLPFVAAGPEAGAVTAHAPLHYPLGEASPVAHLYRLNGSILLVGETHAASSSLHLAEVYADVPYIHRSLALPHGDGTETAMLGSPDCSGGFPRIEPLLRQGRILRRGPVGDAQAQWMRQRFVVSMAVAMLQGEPASLLCDRPDCRPCQRARKYVEQQSAPDDSW